MAATQGCRTNPRSLSPGGEQHWRLRVASSRPALTRQAGRQAIDGIRPENSGSHRTRRWRKGDSNSRSHPEGELSQRVVLVDICDGHTHGAPATAADRGTQVRTRFAAGGSRIRTIGSAEVRRRPRELSCNGAPALSTRRGITSRGPHSTSPVKALLRTSKARR